MTAATRMEGSQTNLDHFAEGMAVAIVSLPVKCNPEMTVLQAAIQGGSLSTFNAVIASLREEFTPEEVRINLLLLWVHWHN